MNGVKLEIDPQIEVGVYNYICQIENPNSNILSITSTQVALENCVLWSFLNLSFVNGVKLEIERESDIKF